MTESTSTSIMLALRTLFDYCVPSVSGGFLKPAYDLEQLVPLTEPEKRDYLEVVIPQAEYFRIKSVTPPAIIEVDPPQYRVMTSGDPHEARKLFLHMLKDRGWETFETRDHPNDSQTIGAWIDIVRGEKLVIAFTVHLSVAQSGFFASTYRVAKRN